MKLSFETKDIIPICIFDGTYCFVFLVCMSEGNTHVLMAAYLKCNQLLPFIVHLLCLLYEN